MSRPLTMTEQVLERLARERTEPVDTPYQRRRSDDALKPDPEMWAALKHGEGLREILVDFYNRVFVDPRLAPFFGKVTKDWIVEKQFSFLQQIFTGERVYFGNRPRNAHHWMVISDELFDYREQLMVDCMRRWGLAEPLVERWRAAENIFRKQIVKDVAIPRKVDGVEMPLHGFEDTNILVATVCDGCAAEVLEGARVRTHVRTGKTYCSACVEAGRAVESAMPV